MQSSQYFPLNPTRHLKHHRGPVSTFVTPTETYIAEKSLHYLLAFAGFVTKSVVFVAARQTDRCRQKYFFFNNSSSFEHYYSSPF